MTINELQKYAQERKCSIMEATIQNWWRLDENVKFAIAKEALLLIEPENENDLLEQLGEWHSELWKVELNKEQIGRLREEWKIYENFTITSATFDTHTREFEVEVIYANNNEFIECVQNLGQDTIDYIMQ